MNEWTAPIHPGEILLDELVEIEMTVEGLAERLQIESAILQSITRGEMDLNANHALRLGRFFGTGPEFWLNLQKAYELEVARLDQDFQLEQIVPLYP